MGFLDVISSDFARLSAETSTAETSAQKDYDVFMQTAEDDKLAKEKQARHNGFEKTRTKHALSVAQKDLEATQTELNAALDYYEKLKPSCMPKPPSYEERKKRREGEIENLKDAYDLLSHDGGMA